MVLNREKRKVGGSTPPLTTSSDQPKRPGGFLRPARLTATVTATAAFGLGQRVAQLGECLAFSSSAVCAQIVIVTSMSLWPRAFRPAAGTPKCPVGGAPAGAGE